MGSAIHSGYSVACAQGRHEWPETRDPSEARTAKRLSSLWLLDAAPDMRSLTCPRLNSLRWHKSPDSLQGQFRPQLVRQPLIDLEKLVQQIVGIPQTGREE